MSVSPSHRRFTIRLAVVYTIVWALLAIDPSYRLDWALENIVVAVAGLILIISWKWFAFSRLSYVLMALFLMLHAIGAHYTYSEVPYDSFFNRITGRSLNSILGWDRNHFDRVIHFLYGLLLTLPFREALLHFAKVSWAFWSYLLPVSFILSTSLIYELLEWAAVIVLGDGAGMAWLGAQGDIWDAHWDSFFAMIGAILATFAMASVHLITGRDLTREWVDNQT